MGLPRRKLLLGGRSWSASVELLRCANLVRVNARCSVAHTTRTLHLRAVWTVDGGVSSGSLIRSSEVRRQISDIVEAPKKSRTCSIRTAVSGATAALIKKASMKVYSVGMCASLYPCPLESRDL